MLSIQLDLFSLPHWTVSITETHTYLLCLLCAFSSPRSLSLHLHVLYSICSSGLAAKDSADHVRSLTTSDKLIIFLFQWTGDSKIWGFSFQPLNYIGISRRRRCNCDSDAWCKCQRSKQTMKLCIYYYYYYIPFHFFFICIHQTDIKCVLWEASILFLTGWSSFSPWLYYWLYEKVRGCFFCFFGKKNRRKIELAAEIPKKTHGP